MKEVIHFAHGNGFPSPCYRQVLDRLALDHDVAWIDRIGHNEEYPVGENWHYLVDEILNSIRQQSDQPVIAVGHSLGGVLSLIASMEQPQYFKAVILLDSPMLGHFKSGMIKVAKSLGLIDRITPAHRTKNRRQFWADRKELEQYLSTKTLFKSFSEACLNDYIDYGLELTAQGYTLRFDRFQEYQIYRTLPHTLPRYHGRLTVPSAIIYGSKSRVVKASDLRSMHKHYGMKIMMVNGSHMFPMESPGMTAEKIMMAIKILSTRYR